MSKQPNGPRVEPSVEPAAARPQDLDMAVGSDAGKSPSVIADRFNELALAIGAALDDECDALIETLNRIKASNAERRRVFGDEAIAYARHVADLTGAAGAIREQVDRMANNGG